MSKKAVQRENQNAEKPAVHNNIICTHSINKSCYYYQ